jgi:hypothetical protein
MEKRRDGETERRRDEKTRRLRDLEMKDGEIKRWTGGEMEQ